MLNKIYYWQPWCESSDFWRIQNPCIVVWWRHWIHLFGTNFCRLNYLFCLPRCSQWRFSPSFGRWKSEWFFHQHVDMKETIFFSECLAWQLDPNLKVGKGKKIVFLFSNFEAWWRNIKFTQILDCQRTSCWQFFEITPPILQVDGSRIANMKSQLNLHESQLNLHLSKSTPPKKKATPGPLDSSQTMTP